MNPTALVLGNYRQTVTVLRSLSRAGIRVVVGRQGPARAFTERSRHCYAAWEHPDPRSPEFVPLLESRLKHGAPRIDYVFPVGEFELEALARNADRLGRLARLVMADPETTLICLDKDRLYALAREAGLPVPPTHTWSERARWAEAAAAAGYPMMAKHSTSLHAVRGEKALRIGTPEELADLLAQPGESPETLLLQKRIEGPRINCHFAARGGRLIAYFEQKVLRTDRPDGTGYGVEGVSVPPSSDLQSWTASLAQKLRYSGAGCVQFLRVEPPAAAPGSAPAAWLLELNPRLDANCALPYACGVDFPRLAIECLGSDPALGLHNAAYPAGVRMHWLLGDLMGCLQALRARRIRPREALRWLGRAARAALTSSRHATWSVSDPMPTLSLYGALLLAPLRKLGRRRA